MKENIFAQLESSEYFIFVDFKREELRTGGKSAKHRGSLFCHQELAIASYLNIPWLAFQENGVKECDGLLGFLQGNVISFSDTHLLPNVIADEVRTKGWDANWKASLQVTRCSSDFEDATNGFGVCRFFQIDVLNNHKCRIAVNCYAYLESAYDLSTGNRFPIDSAEHKWRGYVFPNAAIMPQSHRRFDAFFVQHASPRELLFNIYTDYAGMRPKLFGAGPFDLNYVVLSENFPVARGTFRLTLADRLEDIALEHRRNS